MGEPASGGDARFLRWSVDGGPSGLLGWGMLLQVRRHACAARRGWECFGAKLANRGLRGFAAVLGL